MRSSMPKALKSGNVSSTTAITEVCEKAWTETEKQTMIIRLQNRNKNCLEFIGLERNQSGQGDLA